MLYYLFTYLDREFDIPGAGVFQYISFRTSMAVILSLFITTVYGSRLIKILRAKQVGETVRNLGLEGQMNKQGTPTKAPAKITSSAELGIYMIFKY